MLCVQRQCLTPATPLSLRRRQAKKPGSNSYNIKHEGIHISSLRMYYKKWGSLLGGGGGHAQVGDGGALAGSGVAGCCRLRLIPIHYSQDAGKRTPAKQVVRLRECEHSGLSVHAGHWQEAGGGVRGRSPAAQVGAALQRQQRRCVIKYACERGSWPCCTTARWVMEGSERCAAAGQGWSVMHSARFPLQLCAG